MKALIQDRTGIVAVRSNARPTRQGRRSHLRPVLSHARRINASIEPREASWQLLVVIHLYRGIPSGCWPGMRNDRKKTAEPCRRLLTRTPWLHCMAMH